MTNEENIKAILESNFAGFKGEIIERATKSILELEPKKSDDAIHRGDVLTAINDFCQCVEEYGAYSKLYDFVENLPPVSTEKTGRWEWVQYDFDPNLGNWHCSECRNILVHAVKKDDVGGIPIAKYCPNCGRRMMEQPYKGEKNISKGFEDFIIKSLQRQGESEDEE